MKVRGCVYPFSPSQAKTFGSKFKFLRRKEALSAMTDGLTGINGVFGWFQR